MKFPGDKSRDWT